MKLLIFSKLVNFSGLTTIFQYHLERFKDHPEDLKIIISQSFVIFQDYFALFGSH